MKRGIVLSRERHPIFRDSDVVENLKIAGYLHKRHEVKERIEFIFKLFPHLEGMKKRKAGLLSGGEQQMLAIGIALVAKPRFLLMDEPLLGLSPSFKRIWLGRSKAFGTRDYSTGNRTICQDPPAYHRSGICDRKRNACL